ncbi:MAG: hypothetical protein H7A53_00075 [Akkermansiaceae bacterium]|nr:hypothetical protein [Akkermansiaceae bacterium]MCP5549280.1 hypothetical protein [Akkermansiaceae bacterium]
MNSDNGPDHPQSQDESLLDALLREHARLGSCDDEGLIASVRALTVDKPEPLRRPLPAKARFGAADWMKAAAAVMISLGLLWLVLAKGPALHREDGAAARVETVFQLRVLPADTEDPGLSPSHRSSAKRSAVAGAIAQGPEAPVITGVAPGAPDAAFVNGNPDSVTGELLAEFSVTADSIFRSPENDRLVYEGGVIVKHPDFVLKADRIEFEAGTVGDDRIDTFVARGRAIEVNRHAAGGALEIASARVVTYRAEGGLLTLSGGPPSLKIGPNLITPLTAEGEIVLRNDGFQVIDR